MSSKKAEQDKELVYASPQMRDVIDEVMTFAPTNVPVMITGSTGTGKENIAKLIHNCSDRANRPFIAINCAAISPSLIESELFGHEKGSFTGADQTHAGAFERANGGTLFLDEIGEMPPELQVKLLRVLQDGEFTRVGGKENITAKPRIVSATNIKIEESLKSGKLRRDLYERLNGVEIKIPDLRKREDDISALATHFANKAAEEYGYKKPEIPEDTMAALKAHAWPGNVRELERRIVQATIRTKDTGIITPESLGIEPAMVLTFNGIGPGDENDNNKEQVGSKVNALKLDRANSSPNSYHPSEQVIKLRHDLRSFFLDEKQQPIKLAIIAGEAKLNINALTSILVDSALIDPLKIGGLSVKTRDGLSGYLAGKGKDAAAFQKKFDELRQVTGWKGKSRTQDEEGSGRNWVEALNREKEMAAVAGSNSFELQSILGTNGSRIERTNLIASLSSDPEFLSQREKLRDFFTDNSGEMIDFTKIDQKFALNPKDVFSIIGKGNQVPTQGSLSDETKENLGDLLLSMKKPMFVKENFDREFDKMKAIVNRLRLKYKDNGQNGAITIPGR